MLGSDNLTTLASSTIYLVDFGVSTKYLDKDDTHINMGESDIFVGSVLFSSKNAMMNKLQSRRDDLISLCYLLVYMLSGKLEFLG